MKRGKNKTKWAQLRVFLGHRVQVHQIEVFDQSRKIKMKLSKIKLSKIHENYIFRNMNVMMHPSRVCVAKSCRVQVAAHTEPDKFAK